MSFKHIIIPARRGSKGWPRKNVRLFDHTIAQIPAQYRNKVIVSTDDEQIEAMAIESGLQTYIRDINISNDQSDTRTTLQKTLVNRKLRKDDVIIMMYLTYPDRKWDDVTAMYNTFISSDNTTSMLCRQPVLTHPYLAMIIDEDTNEPRQVIPHNCYQRQQYPECFEISHYICMFRYGELKNLNKNMYNEHTRYFSISRTIDVDSEDDYKKYCGTLYKTST